MTNKKFNDLFGNLPRDPRKDEIVQFHMDIAALIQKVTEDIIIKIVKIFEKNMELKIFV